MRAERQAAPRARHQRAGTDHLALGSRLEPAAETPHRAERCLAFVLGSPCVTAAS